jgi:sulfur-oxidizing protein SoxX
MNAMNRKIIAGLAATLACSAVLADEIRNYRAEAVAMMKRDFKAKGIATTDRLHEDGVQAICNRSGDNPPKDIAARLEKDQLEAIKYPADGKLMGDWKAGEKLAQSGRGMTWSDKAGVPGGGNCYNCHQISPTEASFGTIGPSLYQFGKTRGSGPDMQKYVYGKIWNAKAFNLCSAMPRFGHANALNEQQIKNLVALLLDPQSPVNSK